MRLLFFQLFYSLVGLSQKEGGESSGLKDEFEKVWQKVLSFQDPTSTKRLVTALLTRCEQQLSSLKHPWLRRGT
jgi:hypothetical protein